jgi:hypothetical protein
MSLLRSANNEQENTYTLPLSIYQKAACKTFCDISPVSGGSSIGSHLLHYQELLFCTLFSPVNFGDKFSSPVFCFLALYHLQYHGGFQQPSNVSATLGMLKSIMHCVVLRQARVKASGDEFAR